MKRLSTIALATFLFVSIAGYRWMSKVAADSSDFSTIKPWVSAFQSPDITHTDTERYTSLKPVFIEILSPRFLLALQGLFRGIFITSVNINAP